MSWIQWNCLAIRPLQLIVVCDEHWAGNTVSVNPALWNRSVKKKPGLRLLAARFARVSGLYVTNRSGGNALSEVIGGAGAPGLIGRKRYLDGLISE